MIDFSLPLVCDASVVLNLGHRGALEGLTRTLATDLNLKFTITTEVEKEVSRDDPHFYGKFLNACFQIDRSPLCRIADVEQAALPRFLDSGEKSILSLCLQTGWQACMDEIAGRRVAKNLEISVFGTLGILQIGIVHGLMSDEESLDAVRRLRTGGFYCPKVIINETFAEYCARFSQKS